MSKSAVSRILGLAAVLSASAAYAQPAPGTLESIKVILSDQQNAPVGGKADELKKWVVARADEMWAHEDNGEGSLQSQFDRLRTQLMPVEVDSTRQANYLDFVRAVAKIYDEALTPYILSKPAPKHTFAYIHAAFVITTFRHPELMTTYVKMIENFKEDVPALRYRVMWALATPLVKVETARNNAVAQSVRTMLVKQAGKEDSGPTLHQLFDALDLVPVPAADKTTLETLLPALRARMELYTEGKMGGVGGEVRGLETLERLIPSTALFNPVKLEAVEILGKLVYTLGTRHTQFDQAVVNNLRIRRRPVQQMRQGVWESLVAADRLLGGLVNTMPPVPAKLPAIEKELAQLVIGVTVAGKAVTDPVESEIGLVGDSVIGYRALLQQVAERRRQVTAALSQAKYTGGGGPNIPEPKAWTAALDAPRPAAAPAMPMMPAANPKTPVTKPGTTPGKK